MAYHGVSATEPIGHNSRFVSAARLEAELAGLQAVRGVRFVTLVELLEGKPDPDHACFALTFDDGYRGVMLHALPVLERLGIPATLFVTAAHAGSGADLPMLPADRVDLAALLGAEAFELGGDRFSLGSGREWSRESDGTTLKDLLWRCDRRFIADLAEALPIERTIPAELDDYWKLLTPDDIAQLGRHPLITIGSHGVSHASIEALEPDEATYELETSRTWLARTSGQPVDLFAFPHGTWSRTAVEQAASLGYRWQMAEGSKTEAGELAGTLANRLGNNYYLSSRMQIACLLAGGYDGRAIEP